MNAALRKLLEDEAKKSPESVIKATKSFGFYSTGFPYIDSCVSPDGLFPKGSIVELMGLKSTCKTTLALHAIGEAIRQNQSNPPIVLWADFENQLLNMAKYAKALGVDIQADNFIHRRPSTLEEGCQYIIEAVRTGGLQFVVIDSNAAMRPSKEAEAGIGNMHQKGTRGYLISEFCRNLTAELAGLAEHNITPPTIIIINQLYQKIQLNTRLPVPIYDSPGSETIKFYASCRIELKLTGGLKRELTNAFTFKKDETRVCSFVDLFVEKSKVGIPHHRVSFAVRYGEGIDIIMSFMQAAQTAGIIQKKGSSSRLIYSDSKGKESDSFNGFFKLYDYLREHHDVVLDLAKHSKLSLWYKALESKLPMINYARQIMAESLSSIESGSDYIIEEGTSADFVEDKTL